MANLDHLKIIERVAELCLAVNLRIQAEFSQFELEDVSLEDGVLRLTRAFQPDESLVGDFDEGQKLDSLEKKHKNAALMYCQCTFSVIFFGWFIERVLENVLDEGEEMIVRARAFSLPEGSCKFQVLGRLSGENDETLVTACTHEALLATIGGGEFVIDLSIAHYGFAKCGYTRTEYDAQMSPGEEMEYVSPRLDEDLEEAPQQSLQAEIRAPHDINIYRVF